MNTHSIAVIGLGCVYPGAHSVEELWTNILAGRRYFRRSPDERLPDRHYYDPDSDVIDKTYCNRMAVLADWQFNPIDWKIPPITFEQSDIVHWLALHTASQAIEDAQLDFEKTDKRQVGVILGNSGIGEFHRSHLLRNRWPFVERAVRRAVEKTVTGEDADALVEAIKHYYTGPFPEFREDHLAGNMANVIAGRISNYYDFRGPSYTVDGACASSLLAVINACMQLRTGDMDVCLAGGVDISLDPLEVIGFAKTQALAVEDIRPYDERAHGMQPGEGCGLVVLATEEYARRHGYTIHALIRGWGVSADGRGGITQPKIEGQKFAVDKAYRDVGFDIASVEYIEGHGTGTAVGDRVEVTAIKGAIDEAGGKDRIHWLGSIKANIGHTKAAAGAAGLIKTVRALERKIIPPHVGCYKANEAFGKPLGNLRPAKGGAWLSDEPRRAAVSAFGFGGANAHVTLEEANPDDLPAQSEIDLLGSAQGSELLLLSGRSLFELKEKAEKLYVSATRMCEADLIDAAAALAKMEPSGAYRVAIVTSKPWQLTEQLKTLVHKISEGLTLDEIDNPEGGLFAAETRTNPTLAAFFPGQGSHRLNMAQHWLRRYGFARDMCQRFEGRMYELTGESFKKRVFRDLDGADETARKRWADELRQTVFQQPSIVSCSMAALKVLEHFGLTPDYAVGHSLGEISALVAGGAIEPVDALHIAALRAQAMNSAAGKATGGMAAFGLGADELTAFLKANRLDLIISNFNSIQQNVVSGPIEEIDRAVALAAQRNVWARKLDVSHAFHSPAVAPAAATLRKALDDVAIGALKGTEVFSTATGARLERKTDLRELLAGQIIRPVRFVEAVQGIAAEKPDLWVEVGPGQVLTNLARTIIEDEKVEAYATDLGGEDEFGPLNRLLARAFVFGFPVRTDRLFDGRFHRALDPFHHEPVLITNPCERKVPSLAKPLSLGVSGLPGHVLPEEAGPEFPEYLAQRQGFLREMIRLDYQNWPGAAGSQPPKTSAEAPANAASAGGDDTASTESDDRPIIDTVIDWIVQRTGYPRDFVTPDKTLRDDLNLDSIKAGELALMLSKKMERELPLDLGIVANATIEYLVDTVSKFEGQRFGMDESTFNRWIKSFGVELLPASMNNEAAVPLQATGSLVVMGRDGCPRREAVSAAMAAKGLSVKTLTIDDAITGDSWEQVSGLVLVLPGEERPFFEIKPSEFRQRVEGLAAKLFELMKKVLHERHLEREDFRCVIVRPAADPDAAGDLDGAAAFFKTLALEHNKPAWVWKWLTVPAAWTPDAMGRVVMKEIEHRGDRIEYHYEPDGERLSPTSVQIGTNGPPAPRFGALDTILVSGGGKGITFEMAFELARKTGVKLGLIGSSPAPGADDTESELAVNLDKLRAEAVRHLYVQADVTQHGAVVEAVRKIERKLGRITGILHGAGISRFSEFVNMELEDYLRCIRIKATGLYNLLAAVPPRRLKSLHVISSVLGRTGMFRQADYTFANAWLDGATRSVLRKFPKIHGFSIGYTVWEETGIGAKSGSLEMLQTVGVTPLPKQDGIDAYINLATRRYPFQTYVCTGRLNGEVETRLMPTLELPAWRFLEKSLRFVPGVDLVAEASLSHEADRYIPEHVFAGTPLMPTVLGLEAMVQAAMACTGLRELPAIQDIRLLRPMIVPEASGLVVRTMAVADATEGGVTPVTVRMRSESDGFVGDHFEIRCLFGLSENETEETLRAPALPSDAYPKSPEAFAPVPLFQGRFFRRITKIHRIVEGEETLTEITTPSGAIYYGDGFDQQTQTPAPAIRDAMLQSAALMAPAGYLPEGIKAIYFSRPVRDGEVLTCHTKAVARDEDTLEADIALFDKDGEAVERIQGLVVRAPSVPVELSSGKAESKIAVSDFSRRLQDVTDGVSPVIAVADHRELTEVASEDLLPRTDREALVRDIEPPRRDAVLGNLLAARRAAMAYLEKVTGQPPAPGDIALRHTETGKPELLLRSAAESAETIDVSITDCEGLSVAAVGARPVGVDIEPVETRDSETWQGLLGFDGYDLALRVQRETGESFDTVATRVWTLIEAGKKANGLRRTLPAFERSVQDGWLLFQGPDGAPVLSVATTNGAEGGPLVLSLTAPELVRREVSTHG